MHETVSKGGGERFIVLTKIKTSLKRHNSTTSRNSFFLFTAFLHVCHFLIH